MSPIEKSVLHSEVCQRFNPLATSDAALGLRHITLLGGYSTPTHYDADDFFDLELALGNLRQNAIPLHETFTIDSINLDRQNRDFLRAPPATDLLIVCFVHNPSPGFAEVCQNTQNRPSGISDLHFIPGIWTKAAEKSGARAIFINGGRDELSAKHFAGAPFVIAEENQRHSFNSALLLRETYARELIESKKMPDAPRQTLQNQLKPFKP